MTRRLFTLLVVPSLLLFAALLLSWIAALLHPLIPNMPRWAEPCVAWRVTPTHGHALMLTRTGLSLETRSLPWPPRTWPARSIYDPSPDGALENIDRILNVMPVRKARALR